MVKEKIKPEGDVLQSLRKVWLLLTQRNRWRLVLLIGVVLSQTLLEIIGISAIPALVAALSDPTRVLQHAYVGPWMQRFGVRTQLELLVSVTVVLVSVFCAKTLYAYFAARVIGKFLRDLRLYVGARLFSAYMYAPYVFQLKRNSAELMRNVTQEVDRMVYQVVMPVLAMLVHGFIAVCIVVLMLVVDVWVTLLGVGLFATSTYLFLALLRRRSTAIGISAQAERAELIKSVNQGLGGFKEARVLGRERSFVDAFRRSTRELADMAVHFYLSQVMIPPGLELVAVLGLAGIVALLLAVGTATGDIVPVLALFAAAVVRLRQALTQIVTTANTLRYEHVTVEPIYRDLKALEDVGMLEAPPAPRDRMPFLNAIELSNVSFRYSEDGPWALQDVSLTISRGASIAFVGATGSGKSTLADVLLGLLEPQRGKVTVDGRDIHDRLGGWRANLGYIPQSLYLIDDTVRRNIAFGLPDHEIDEDQLLVAARTAQLDEVLATMPDGLETMLGDRGVRLSGGQRQRVCIARALYHNPDILIMDEATSALDNLTERRIVEELEAQRGDRTLIIIAHRLSTVKRCDMLYLMRNGRVDAAGTFNELFSSNQRFQALASSEA